MHSLERPPLPLVKPPAQAASHRPSGHRPPVARFYDNFGAKQGLSLQGRFEISSDPIWTSIILGSRSEIPQLRYSCAIWDNGWVTNNDSTVTLVFLHHIFRDLACFFPLTDHQRCLPITATLGMVSQTGTKNQFQVVSVTIRRRIGLELRVFVVSLLRMSVNK